jgi:glycosyltransferase involved in cell wall biosynthesis
MAAPLSVELIISTYNCPRSLALCLVSVGLQDLASDGICIADDGSGPETRALIEGFAARSTVPVRHIWHPDTGFEKGAILNRAIATSSAVFLVFIDGDVMINPGFLRRHVNLARTGRFSTGSLIRLDASSTAGMTADKITTGLVFQPKWLRDNRAIRGATDWLKSAPLPRVLLDLIERIYPIRRSFCGANASAFRSDIMAVNGYDERIKYGGQDKDLGVRLKMAGVLGRHVRFTTPLVHLDHPRGYDSPEVRNREIRAETAALNRARTPYGIEKSA